MKFALAILGVLILAELGWSLKASEGYEQVTCGSIIKLVHSSGYYLHSHEVKYGSGSGQQSVTGFPPGDPDTNSMWAVQGAYGVYCKRGEPIKCGSSIRLEHLNTRRYLHSHLHPSPLSNNQEVSAFGENGSSDSGDNWKVECSGSTWKRDENVRLKHTDTNMYLHSHVGFRYRRPIDGQQEVCAYGYKNNDNLWRTDEGLFIKAE
eukprot:Colp12_sorted_trinity150504_noHs@18949